MSKQVYIMMMLFCLVISKCFAFQQADSIIVNIKPVFGKEELKIQNKYISAKKDTLSIDVLRFYISDVKVTYTDKTISQQKKAWLLDINKPESLQFNIASLSRKQIAQITFNVGVDSLANVSGALGGALDPANGMYWAWQSGYINMKVEGKSNSCQTRKNKFMFHIGGYLPKENALRVVTIPVSKSTNDSISIKVDLSIFFNEINLKENNSIMIPGTKAMLIADLTGKMFSLQ
ncbi:hypothetical protein DVK85_09015 [Flavobacterium arcticum]|uniref:Copper-binding protein MbnP-like domain-containing protein n=1 Tax=Flavobacterium arcticum TaxID=1784713 RepID=A0A345HCQ3_9FLAO|nr:MbnP family protein [Flavobacterium arcticum]AXG74363.1 hypothetical protein DVK85_09015 [Flavobacterium arcticum]KAF2507522.1 hypothetical protein E0W72_11635 [Flavobacterium arcticum]